jgi:hypothetical protein
MRANYMQALPRAKLKQPEWEIAAETLLAAVEGSGPLLHRGAGGGGRCSSFGLY